MAILWKVKGYINGNVWWVNDSSSSLRSYDDLISTENYQDSLNELNNSPESYYDKLTNEWHIYYHDVAERYFLANSSWSSAQTWSTWTTVYSSSIWLYYDLQNKIWATDTPDEYPE